MGYIEIPYYLQGPEMNFPGNPDSMTAMKVTKEFMLECADKTQSAEVVPDNDPIYEGYIVILPDNEFTIAPNAVEFFETFEFVKEETPGHFAPIKYKA